MEENLNNSQKSEQKEIFKKPIIEAYLNDKGEVNYTTDWSVVSVEIAQQLVKIIRESASSHYF